MQTNFSNQKGFSLLELIIAAAIAVVISAISVSAYTGYIDTTKNAQAETQIRALSFLIDDYASEYGEYPNSLKDIGNENLKDPWGNPYIYFNLRKDNGQGSGGSDDDEHGSSDDHGGSDDDEHGRSDDDDHGRSDDDDHGRSDGDDDEHGSNNEHSGKNTNIGAARKDGNLVPINTNYDLCSYGKDGKSKAPLRAKDSHDDIIYANDGGYIGLASEF